MIMKGFKLRDYQEEIKNKAQSILDNLGMVYLNMQVRTGKSLTALSLVNNSKALFITKKKAIASIESDHEMGGFDNEYFKVINYESLHKVKLPADLDYIIIDEAHAIGTYPKPSKRYKDIKKIVNKYECKIIFLSGTASPESYSQLFHQFHISDLYSPFRSYRNFYSWAKEFVNVKKKYIAHGNQVNDYSNANKEKVLSHVAKYFITYTQEQAGFSNQVNEKIHTVKMQDITYITCNQLKKDLVVEGKTELILADTGVKLQSKIHQLYSGTIKFESGSRMTLDYTKGHYIKENFVGKKIAIFYVFQEEFNLLKNIFPDFTTSPEEFNENDDLVYLGQVRASREGVNLSTADDLIMYNIEFSALSYLQGKDRMSSKDRLKPNNVHWIFAEGGIEEKIYEAVQRKKDYTLSYFCRDFGVNKKIFK